jgi:hypothetical protein
MHKNDSSAGHKRATLHILLAQLDFVHIKNREHKNPMFAQSVCLLQTVVTCFVLLLLRVLCNHQCDRMGQNFATI